MGWSCSCFVEMKRLGSLFAKCAVCSSTESGALKYNLISLPKDIEVCICSFMSWSLPSHWLAEWHPAVQFLGWTSTAMGLSGPSPGLFPSVWIGDHYLSIILGHDKEAGCDCDLRMTSQHMLSSTWPYNAAGLRSTICTLAGEPI